MANEGQNEGHARENLLTPAEVAAIFRVDPKTVAGWAKAGKLTAIKTLGGHRRYLESEVMALVRQERRDRDETGDQRRGEPGGAGGPGESGGRQ